MTDPNGLYRAIGFKMRAARERYEPKLSQAKLAKRLGISRVSIVNIEAGRQHAPVSLLWQIAEALEIELSVLIPRRSELHGSPPTIQLDQRTIDQIRHAAVGNRETVEKLTGAITKLKATLETQPATLGNDEATHDTPIGRTAR